MSDKLALQLTRSDLLQHDEPIGLAAFSEHVWASAKYNFAQQPINGVVQLADHLTGMKNLEQVQFFEAPKAAAFGTAAWAGDLVGGTAAVGAQFALLHRVVGVGAAAKLETSNEYGLGKLAVPAITKAALTGLAIGGVFTPVGDQDGDFVLARLRNAGISSLTFSCLTAGAIGLKSTGHKILSNDIVANGLLGIPAGIIDADGKSFLKDRHLTSWNERLQSVANYSLGGMMAGGANMLHEAAAPSSGIRAVRTAKDMAALADTTIKEGHPERWAYIDEHAAPQSIEEMIASGRPKSWLDRSFINLSSEIEGSHMPDAYRERVVGSMTQLANSIEVLSTRNDPKPIMVIYGSARFRPGDFRYERARYIGGTAVAEGYDVMTGGGPGTMEGGNRGAYEAGGTSIGVVLKLPMEKRGNGYQTHTLEHSDFFTRMDVLKMVGLGVEKGGKPGVLVVEEGGIGTAAEALDTLTHIQTRKMDKVPVYFHEEWRKPVETMLSWMNSKGTISKGDRNLYRFYSNPDEIFVDLRKRVEATALSNPPQAQVQAPALQLAH